MAQGQGRIAAREASARTGGHRHERFSGCRDDGEGAVRKAFPWVRWAGLLVSSLVLSGVSCGGLQGRPALFSTDWEDDGGASIGRVWQRIGSRPVSTSADVVVGVAGRGDKIIGLPLS